MLEPKKFPKVPKDVMEEINLSEEAFKKKILEGYDSRTDGLPPEDILDEQQKIENDEIENAKKEKEVKGEKF